MQQQVVLVRGDCGKPVRLVAVHASDGLIYVSSERALEDDSGMPPPIGVPKYDVFKFDPAQYEQLREKWEREGRTAENDWQKLEAAN
jgi:hypothetical protein